MKASKQIGLQLPPSYIHLVCGWRGEAKQFAVAPNGRNLLCPGCGLAVVGMVHRDEVGSREYWGIRRHILDQARQLRKEAGLVLPPEIMELDHQAARLVALGAKA